MVVKGANVETPPIISSGDCSCDWVAHTLYFYRIAPHNTDKTKCAFQVIAKVNLEFSKGGSIEFNSMITYDLQEVVVKPMLMNLMQLSKEASGKLIPLFREMLQVTGPINGILDPETDEVMGMAIGQELISAYNL